MPASTENGDISVRKTIEQENKENIPPPTPRVRLDRSPHPYHRSQPSPSGSETKSGRTFVGHYIQPATISPYERRQCKERLPDANNQKPPTTATSSDSGTEADDESGGVLRALPAPPIRRKGSSPFLMPRNMDDERRKPCLEHKAKHEGSRSAPSLGDEGDRKIRDKFTRRRRAEYLRRLSETILLGSVGLIACGKRHELFLRTLSRGVLSSNRRAICHPDGRL